MSGTNKINIAIIGNNFGRKVHLPAFQSIEGVNVAGIYGSKDNCREIIADANIQAICLSVPPSFSYDLLKIAIEHKKHIFCEKPLVSNLENAQKIANLLTNDIITAINFEICESRIVKKLKDILINKRKNWFRLEWRLPNTRSINHPHHWKDDIKKGGGIINNFGSHIFNLLEFILGENILSIEKEFMKPNEMSLLINFGEYSGTIYIKYGSSYNIPKFIFNIHCEDQYYELKNETNKLKNFTLLDTNEYPIIILDIENDISDNDGRIDLTHSLATKFINGIKTGTQIRPNIYDGLRVQELIDKVINV